jgi:MobA/MobL family protein
MANAHFHRIPTYAGTGVGQARTRIAYITRTGAYVPWTEDQGQDGAVPGPERTLEDCIESGQANLPRWTDNDPVRYFETCLVRERMMSAMQSDRILTARETGTTIRGVNAGPAFEEWRFHLPRELSREEQLAAAHAFLDAAFGDKHPYVYGIHDPLASDGGHQPHVHVLWSRRRLDGIERSEAQWFKNYKRRDPAHGGAERPPHFGAYGSVKRDRVLYCDVMNIHLEAAGQPDRLHPDRLADRGFDRPLEPRARVSDSTALKQKGVVTPRWQEVLDHRETYGPGKAVERVNAQRYWHERKAALGLKGLPLPAQLATVQALRWGPPAPPARERRGKQRTPILTALVSRRPQSRRTTMGQLAALSASLDRLAQGEEHEHGRGRPRLRLHEEEQDRGMSW